MTRDKSKRHTIIKYMMAFPLLILMTMLFSIQDLMAQFSPDNFKNKLAATISDFDKQSNDEKLKTYEKIYDLISAEKKEYPNNVKAIESVIEEVLYKGNIPLDQLGNYTENGLLIYRTADEMPLFESCGDASFTKEKKDAGELAED